MLQQWTVIAERRGDDTHVPRPAHYGPFASRDTAEQCAIEVSKHRDCIGVRIVEVREAKFGNRNSE